MVDFTNQLINETSNTTTSTEALVGSDQDIPMIQTEGESSPLFSYYEMPAIPHTNHELNALKISFLEDCISDLQSQLDASKAAEIEKSIKVVELDNLLIESSNRVEFLRDRIDHYEGQIEQEENQVFYFRRQLQLAQETLEITVRDFQEQMKNMSERNITHVNNIRQDYHDLEREIMVVSEQNAIQADEIIKLRAQMEKERETATQAILRKLTHSSQETLYMSEIIRKLSEKVDSCLAFSSLFPSNPDSPPLLNGPFI